MFDLLLKKLLEALKLPGELIGDILEIWSLLHKVIEDEVRREAEIAQFVAALRDGNVPPLAEAVLKIVSNGRSLEDLLKEVISR